MFCQHVTSGHEVNNYIIHYLRYITVSYNGNLILSPFINPGWKAKFTDDKYYELLNIKTTINLFIRSSHSIVSLAKLSTEKIRTIGLNISPIQQNNQCTSHYSWLKLRVIKNIEKYFKQRMKETKNLLHHLHFKDLEKSICLYTHCGEKSQTGWCVRGII